jgi:tetratricopeptide (TPR) repeat protein
MTSDRQDQLPASIAAEERPASASQAGETWLDVEIRILDRYDDIYPVELTLNNEQVFRGRLSSELTPWTSSGDALTDGQVLFKALFASSDLAKGWGAAHEKSPQRRVRLRIDPPELHLLPWELLHDGRTLLAAQADTPFSRYLPIDLPWGGAIAARPLRVLVAISDPTDITTRYDLPPSNVAAEKQALLDAVSNLPGEVQLEFMDGPITLSRLESKLREGYHVLHVIAHGSFNARRQQAALYLQQDDGISQRVTDDEFTGMLARLSVVPALVIIAACQSAQRSALDAYLGLGPRLVKAGLPAVVAMQDNVTMATARQFSAALYTQLLSHGAIDRAVNEARSTALTTGRPDAAVPVLFMRLKDGRLVSKPRTKPSRKRRVLALTAILSGLLLIGLALFLFSKRITPMGAGFNIAVAAFTEQLPDGTVHVTDDSTSLSEWLYNALEREAMQLPETFKFETRGPKAIGGVEGGDEAVRVQRAREIARSHNATILIYGSIVTATGNYQVTPRFYINDQAFTYGSEVTGPDRLGQAVAFDPPLGEPGTLQGINAKLDVRVSVLQHLMKGLAHFYLGQHQGAISEYDMALDNPAWAPNEGQEVLYLLKGSALMQLYDPYAALDERLKLLGSANDSFAQAYAINPEYSRSFLGLGSVALQQAILDRTLTDVEKLREAGSWYVRAKESADQPLAAQVPLKAALGLGQVHLVGAKSNIPGWSLDQARALFQHVIDAYDADPAPDRIALAADAHCGLGQAAGLIGDWQTTSIECRKAIDLLQRLPGSRSGILARYWALIGKAEETNRRTEAAKNAYTEAVKLGENAAGVNPDDLAAWKVALERLQ